MSENDRQVAEELYLSSMASHASCKDPIWDNFPRIEQPSELGINLFPHQLVSVHKMELLERIQKINVSDTESYLTRFGVLGDIPGYGKSFSVVALMIRDRMEWDVTKPYPVYQYNTLNSSITHVKKRMHQRIRANLLVASPTLIEQWKEYLSFIKTDIPFRIKEISAVKDLNNFNVNEWDLVLVSSTRFNQLIDLVGPLVVWKRFIFDEAGSTHINAMRHVLAGFTWFVTATYPQLFVSSGNSYHFVKSFMMYLSRDMLRHLVVKNPTEFVQHSFKMPAVNHVRHVCLNPRVLNVLSNYIDDETRLMISAGDIRGAIARIGGGSTNATNLFELVATRQREKLASAKFSLNMWQGRNSSDKEIAFWTNRVSNLEKTLAELEEKYKNVLSDDCSICFSPLTDPILVPCCQNVFCGGCMMRWFDTKKSCPMCRAATDPKDFVYIQNDDANVDEEKKEDRSAEIAARPKQKQETVCQIVSDGLKQGKKFLIFSSYDESFYMIRRELDAKHIAFVEMSGSKVTRDSKLRKFREGKVNVVFLNSRFNGAGINLEMATDIILYHEMTDSIRDQVIGRALRIGRQIDLTIHHLVFQ